MAHSKRDAIDALVRPRAVLVVGASESGGPGTVITNNALGSFDGPIGLVNPRRQTVAGRPALDRVADFDAPDATAIIAVGTDHVAGAVRDCVDAGVRAAIVVTSGFAETGTDVGRAREEELRGLCATHGFQLMGPNCLGVANFADGTHLSIMDVDDLGQHVRSGPTALLSQSGGLLIGLLAQLATRRVGISRAFSTGSEFTLGLEDYLDWLADDEATSVIVAVIEAVNDGQAFLAAATKALAKGKSVVALRVGKTARAQTAVQAHTGRLAGDHAVFEAACAHHGIVLTDDLRELVETVVGLDASPRLPDGPKALAAMISGGAAAYLADAVEGSAIELPLVPESMRAPLREVLPAHASINNPLDITGGAVVHNPGLLREVLSLLAADDDIDLLVFVFPTKSWGGAAAERKLLETVMGFAADSPKPLYLLSPGGDALGGYWQERTGGVAYLQDMLPAVRALGHVATARARQARAARRSRPSGGAEQAAALPDGRSAASGVVGYDETRALLEGAGLPLVAEHEVPAGSGPDALEGLLRYPVVCKLWSRALPHKSDVGGVRASLTGPEELGEAVEALRRLAADKGLADARVLVQPMVEADAEYFVGMTRDAVFGPVVAFGLGGRLVELMPSAVALFVPPVEREDLEALWDREDALGSMLRGYRGARPLDPEEVHGVVGAVAAVASADPAITAIDCNPVMQRAHDGRLVIVDMLIERAAPESG